MKVRSSQGYVKHVYWLTGTDTLRLSEEMESRHINVRRPKGVVCAPLDEVNKISIVSPQIWNGACARQGSWYRTSDKNGLFLIVSSFELKGYEIRKAAILTRSLFDPPRWAQMEEKRLMVIDPEFANQIPPQWQQADQKEKRLSMKWAKKLGSVIEDYALLYVSHTANHANFIKPRFFIQENQILIPYSLDRSAHLCSCCLELFQVIGSQHTKKLIAPCPGAVIFASLKPDQYILVESP